MDRDIEKELVDENSKQIASDSMKCPSCGGNMVFDPASQTLKCPNCGTSENIEKRFSNNERDIEEGFEKCVIWNPSEKINYRCGNCGASVALDPSNKSTLCPFCGTGIIVKSEETPSMKPHVIMPFQFSDKEAIDYAKKYVKKRILAPSKYKKSFSPENIHGVYEPCFTFDSHTESTYYGRVGDRHTRVVGSGKNRRTETYYTYRNVSGTYRLFFDDLLISNNKNLNQQEINKLSPFDSQLVCDFENRYLSGFYSENYEKDVKTCWGEAKVKMDKIIRNNIINSLNCDTVESLTVKTMHIKPTFKYLMMPIYHMAYPYKGKVYTVKINGCSGKGCGKTPKSPVRVSILGVIIAAAVAALGYLAYLYFMA